MTCCSCKMMCTFQLYAHKLSFTCKSLFYVVWLQSYLNRLNIAFTTHNKYISNDDSCDDLKRSVCFLEAAKASAALNGSALYMARFLSRRLPGWIRSMTWHPSFSLSLFTLNMHSTRDGDCCGQFLTNTYYFLSRIRFV